MDEDLGRVQDVSKKYGSTFLNQGLAVLPLHLAASHRKVKSMQTLLSAGADPETRDHLGRTTLHMLIIAWPKIPTWPKPDSKLRTAMIGVHEKAEACLRLLCQHGVNINAQVERESRQTALHLSVRYTAVSAVHILTSHGAHVNAVDSRGMTPLHMAAGMLHKDIIATLIRQGADINMGLKNTGNTPLHFAAVAMAMKTIKTLEDDLNCVSELLEHGAEPNTENEAGITPLHEACSIGNTDLVDLLLRYGANINKLNQAGENCLFLFLDRRCNVMNCSLLVRLLSLTSPLTVYNKNGHLPLTLRLPCFFKQRDQLLKLVQQPRGLQDICKAYIYLQNVRDKKDRVKETLPKRLYDFVFNQWENKHNISFVTKDEEDSLVMY